VKPASCRALADLYACWAPDALYLGLCAIDFVEDTFDRDKQIPEDDRVIREAQAEGRRPGALLRRPPQPCPRLPDRLDREPPPGVLYRPNPVKVSCLVGVFFFGFGLGCRGARRWGTWPQYSNSGQPSLDH
jgi:hypothetical protein